METADYGLPELPSAADCESTPQNTRAKTQIDWGEKPDTAIFFGRTEELATLGQWIMVDQCRLVTLLGMGGIGKTSLAAKLVDQIYEQFDYVIWRSLREAPPLDEILVRLIQFLSDQQETESNLPTRLGERIIRLLHYLREYRCLLVLDNLESILQAESTGQFREGYDEYGELIYQLGKAEHQSCLLLTSRECPRGLALMAGEHLPVRVWSVGGIETEAGWEILAAKGLHLEKTENQGQTLVRRYSGNPQALNLVATTIQQEYLGDVYDFLKEEKAGIEGLSGLLNQQLTRLDPLERSILFWLAINREPVGLDELMEDLLPPVTKRDLRSAVRGLRNRSLVEMVDKQFTLQNVIMEFVSDRLVSEIIKEIDTKKFTLLSSHALTKATAKEYVRKTQERIFLNPILDQLSNLEVQASESLDIFRKSIQLSFGYAAGNLLNLLCQAHSEFEKLDFSNLNIRYAYLRKNRFYSLNLSESNFLNSLFVINSGSIRCIAFSPNGKFMVAGGDRGFLGIWGNQEWQQLLIIFEPVDDFFQSLIFSPCSQFLASISEECSTVRIWDIKQRKCIHTLEHPNYVYSIAFNLDGQLLASGSKDSTIRLWDIKQKKCIHIFSDHSNSVNSIAFSPDGQLLASGSKDSTIRLWDIKQKKCIHIFSDHSNRIISIAFSPDGQLLASSSWDATIRIWDVKQKKCVHILEYNAWSNSVAFSPDGQFLASGGEDSKIRLWDLQKQQYVNLVTGFSNWIWSVCFSPDGRMIANTTECDSEIQIWDVQSQKICDKLTTKAIGGLSATFSPNGEFLISSDVSSSIQLWNLQKKLFIHVFLGHSDWITSLEFSPDGIFFASSSWDSTIRLWDVQLRKCVHVLENPDKISSIAFSSDGQMLVSGSWDSTIQLWDVRQRKCVHTFLAHSKRIISVAFSPNNLLLASSSLDNEIRLWDIQQQKCIHIFSDIENSRWTNSQALAFSSDGRFLASIIGASAVRIWDIKQQKCIYTFKCEPSVRILSLAFKPDGKHLASGNSDGTIRLWNLQTGTCSAVLQAPRPYEGTDITGIHGLTEAQRSSMLALGAVDYSTKS
ncbi:MAG: NB-ARC domain-containing protein [Cyanobacteria bacterium P01_B01_bin.77]